MARGWSAADLDQFQRLVKEGRSDYEIASIMGRTTGSVEHQTRGIKNKHRPVFQEVKTAPEDTQDFMGAMSKHLESLKPYKLKKRDNKRYKTGDTLVVHLTDFHAGKIVKDQNGVIYDENIFRHRINQLCRNILKILDNNISKGVPITDVVIIATGDLANGEDIYETQAYEQEMAPPKQVMLCVDVIISLILSLIERRLPVSFYGVRGNHGRTAKDADPTSNWDSMIYKILEFWVRTKELEDKVQISYAEDTESLKFMIRGHTYLARHKAPEQGGTPAGRVKFSAWARNHGAEAVVYGHFHHYSNEDIDNIRVFRGGSTVGGDGLSESMAKYSQPIQICWGVTEERVMTFFYAIDLNGMKEEKQ